MTRAVPHSETSRYLDVLCYHILDIPDTFWGVVLLLLFCGFFCLLLSIGYDYLLAILDQLKFILQILH